MKKLILAAVAVVALMSCITVNAAPVWNMPAIRIQPNGDTLRCFVTGDEFYQRLHDADNYTIVMAPSGYYVYATEENGQMVPSSHVAGTVNPATLGIRPGLTLSEPELLERHKAFEIPERYRAELPKGPANGKNRLNEINNVMIFIRFADENPYSMSINSVNSLVNDSTENAVSMFNFFRHASYGKMRIVTHFYPQPDSTRILSFQDTNSRSYYMPYSDANPNGYRNDSERASREFALIENATAYINANFPVDSNINLDVDNDGNIDNICYVVRGTYTGWADLLWPHKWNLYDRYVYINGKRVNTFNFMLAGAGSDYFGTSTFCHEMTHSLSAPDLYHYYHWTDVHPAGNWDLMEQNTNPPQHQTAWIKYKYCGWIDSIPTLTHEGTYSLAPISQPTHNCWKIPSPDSNQFYVVEYRDKEDDLFEHGLAGSGLIISRIDTRYSGNASFDKENSFDEVYILRPDGNDSVNGTPAQANYSQIVGRTFINSGTDPAPMLTQNIPDTTWAINNITIDGDSLRFTYLKMTGCRVPLDLNVGNITGSSAVLSWNSYADHYRVEYGPADGSYSRVVLQDSNYLNIWGLSKSHNYRFRVRAFCDSTETDAADTSIYSDWKYFQTGSCYNVVRAEFGNGSRQESTVPFASQYRYSYVQQIWTSIELEFNSLNINSLYFNYTASNSLNDKDNVRIYLGEVDRSTFNSQTDMVPLDSLTLVYTGRFDCSKGWNTITLDSNFVYSGEKNLLLAIDDNSNTKGVTGKFQVTSGSSYNAICYSSDSDNPEPEDPADFVGIMARKKFRSNIKFVGCSINSSEEDLAIGDVEDNSMSIIASHLKINVSSETPQTLRLYDISGRMLTQTAEGRDFTLTVPQAGIYILQDASGKAHKVVVM